MDKENQIKIFHLEDRIDLLQELNDLLKTKNTLLREGEQKSETIIQLYKTVFKSLYTLSQDKNYEKISELLNEINKEL